MSLLEKLENFKIDSRDHPDIDYLKQSNIGGIVNWG
jgi:hypothetical protein